MDLLFDALGKFAMRASRFLGAWSCKSTYPSWLGLLGSTLARFEVVLHVVPDGSARVKRRLDH